MPGFRCDRSLQVQVRARSMSATASSHARSSLQDHTNPSISRVRAAPGRHGLSTTKTPYPHRSPLVYPALLSRIAEDLRSRITLSDVVKDGLTYKNAFDGLQAVDKIVYIIKTTDHNLALLLGRALDAQKYLHAITYDHRLRDSSPDVYQFRTRVGSLSTPANFPHRQSPHLVPRVRVPPPLMCALTQVCLRTKRRMSRIQGNIRMQLSSLVLMQTRTRLRM